MNIDVLLVLILFQIKHFLCDYPLQNEYHLRKGQLEGWILPLLDHSMYHAIGTFIILVTFNIELALLLSISEIFIHFTIDRIKASPNMLGVYKPDNKYFWWGLGLDQKLHHVTYILFTYTVFKG